MSIPFNKPLFLGEEIESVSRVQEYGKFSGNGSFTQQCHDWFESNMDIEKAFLTTSCTHALELSALLIDIQPGDEVIMPSYTFVSTSNAFVLRGANVVFVDINPDTMNMDMDLLESAISDQTKAVVPVHYAGVACEMDKLMDIASKHNLYVIEDAAQGIGATYKGKKLGSIGDLGTISFHDTKNLHCGEGGVLLINNENLIESAEIIREKGTNRKRFLRGQVDKYTWVDIGSSYSPSELNAAFLISQLKQLEKITEKRRKLWTSYYNNLISLELQGLIELPKVPEDRTHNAHIFYIKCADIDERSSLISYLYSKNIQAVFHYIPLHASKAGKKYGYMSLDKYTTSESQRLLRLPMYFDLKTSQVESIADHISEFYNSMKNEI